MYKHYFFLNFPGINLFGSLLYQSVFAYLTQEGFVIVLSYFHYFSTDCCDTICELFIGK